MSAGLIPLPLAAGPVIPTFGQASNCIVQNHQFCASWFFDNFSSRFEPRLVEHLELSAIAVGIGSVIAFIAAIIAYKQDWFETPFSLLAAFLYTIPSLAFFELMVPITGINRFSAEIALVSYTLLILFRNTLTGLRGVPRPAIDAAQAMGLTPAQSLVRILGSLIFDAIQTGFKTEFIGAGVLAILLALVVDLVLVIVQRAITPWSRRRLREA
jgi:osmoprotectant transport system permease protein